MNQNDSDLDFAEMRIIETADQSETVNEFRDEAMRQLKTFLIRSLGIVQSYSNRPLALDCLCLAMGQPDLIPLPDELKPATGSPSATIVARKYGMTKQAVTKVVVKFQDCLGIPPMPGQRGEKGRKQMAEARTEQLK